MAPQTAGAHRNITVSPRNNSVIYLVAFQAESVRVLIEQSRKTGGVRLVAGEAVFRDRRMDILSDEFFLVVA